MLAMTTAAYSACTRPSSSGADAATIERAALTTLFVDREHARLLTILRAPRDSAPVLGDVALTTDTLAVPIARLLAMPMPVVVISRRDVDSVFHANPDGWAAWYARYPGSSGLIEITAPVIGIDANGLLAARLFIARSCGEHCRSAWRVVVLRDARGVWRTESAVAIELPRI